MKAELLLAARGTLFLRTAALIATFGSSIILARSLGPTEFGIYSFVFAIATVLALPSQAGIPTLLVRETAKAQANNEWSVLKGLWLWSGRTITLLSASVSLVTVLAAVFWRDRFGPSLSATLVAAALLIPFISLGNARGAALRGLRQVVRAQFPESVVRPSLLMVFVYIGWLYGNEVSAAQAMALHVVAAAIAFGVGAILLRISRPQELSTVASDLRRRSQWLTAAIPLAMFSGLQVIGNQSGIIVLGFFRAEAEVGMYKVAVSASTLALFGLQAINLVIEPHIARLYSRSDRVRLQRLVTLGAVAGSAATIFVWLLFAIDGRRIIAWIYGIEYSGAYIPLIILCTAQVINSAFGSVGLLLTMTGHERDAVRWLGVSASANISFGLLAIPLFGMVGAACASAASLLIWNIAFWRIAANRIGIDGSIRSIFLGQR